MISLTEFQLHSAADVIDGVWDEFVVKDVIVGCIADGAANDANGESEGGDRGNEVVGADDGGDNGGRDDDAADAETSENEKTPSAVQRVCVEGCECSNS